MTAVSEPRQARPRRRPRSHSFRPQRRPTTVPITEFDAVARLSTQTTSTTAATMANIIRRLDVDRPRLAQFSATIAQRNAGWARVYPAVSPPRCNPTSRAPNSRPPGCAVEGARRGRVRPGGGPHARVPRPRSTGRRTSASKTLRRPVTTAPESVIGQSLRPFRHRGAGCRCALLGLFRLTVLGRRVPGKLTATRRRGLTAPSSGANTPRPEGSAGN